MGFVNARGVHQHHLGHLGGEDRPKTIARGLGHRRGDGHLLTDKLIDQGGFTHIGPTDQGDKA